MAFIVDVRRGNVRLHLLYKAIFELSSDRADFVSRLFSMKRPAGLGAKSTAQEIFAAYDDAQLRREELHTQNIAAMRELFKTKKIVLPPEDWTRIESVYGEFFSRGLDIHYEVTPGSAGSFPTYAELMTATDTASVARSFLASEENFVIVRDLQRKNLVVPVVGNFAGTKADPGDRRLPEEARGDRGDVLRLERRTVSAAGRHVRALLRQRRDAAARRGQHLHPQRAGRVRRAQPAGNGRLRTRLHVAAAQHPRRDDELRTRGATDELGDSHGTVTSDCPRSYGVDFSRNARRFSTKLRRLRSPVSTPF